MPKSQKGQILLILILVITVALAVGLAIVQRSLTDVSTSTKVEQSTRAFSAAEAGIEKAMQGDSSLVSFDNDASIKSVDAKPVPGPNEALEYPTVSKEEIVHVWLADPVALAKYYHQGTLDVYWGKVPESAAADIPAIEVVVVVKEGLGYKKKIYLFDPNSDRAMGNGFDNTVTNVCNSPAPGVIPTSFSEDGENRPFCYKATLTNLLTNPATDVLILLRARILYSKDSHQVAVKPLGSCLEVPCSLPVQGKLFTSTGVAGDTQRTVQLFKLDKVVPFYFDYAIFSAGEIKK